MRYALGCAFNIDDLFINFPIKKLSVKRDACLKDCNSKNKKVLARQIFKYTLQVVLLDIVLNNHTFSLPLTGSKKAEIYVKKIEGDNFWKAFLRGVFKGLDYLKSFFTGYLLTFFMYSKNRTREKVIHVNKLIRDIIINNANEGKQYC